MYNKIKIEPGVLSGFVRVSGAKNSALRLLAASILTDEKIELSNYPETLLDAEIHVGMLRALGKSCLVSEGQISISEHRALTTTLEWDDRSIRNTLLVLGALTTRYGFGKVPVPGGCQLGDRKHDLHRLVLETLGAHVTDLGDGWLIAEAENGLLGADIHLPLRSTGATENAILCSTLAKGTTRIWNPHIRPEILDLITMLRKMGAGIDIRGQESIIVQGKEQLMGCQHMVIPDNVEALTWMIGAIVTGGEVEISDFPYSHLEVPLIHLRESGARFYRCQDSMIVRGGKCYPIEISTGPYPGINSDMQPLLAIYGGIANGESKIIDLRFPGRYAYVYELEKLGMRFSVEGNLLKIFGGHTLTGAEVNALDLRAGAALFLAGLVSKGVTTINNAWQICRGYDRFVEKSRSLGVRVSNAAPPSGPPL